MSMMELFEKEQLFRNTFDNFITETLKLQKELNDSMDNISEELRNLQKKRAKERYLSSPCTLQKKIGIVSRNITKNS